MLSLLALGIVGCVGLGGLPGGGASTPSVESSTGMATCRIAADPDNPLIVEWPGTSRTELQNAIDSGIVIVSYAGCDLKVLTGCVAGGSYSFKSSGANVDGFEITDEKELYTKLPLGAATLKGALKSGNTLQFKYVAVGQQIADGAPDYLQGSCPGATHYVRAVTVGAFLLEEQAAGEGSGTVETLVGGGGIGGRKKQRIHRSSGDLEACEKNPEDAQCRRGILKLSLERLPSQTQTDTATGDQFGSGLGGFSTLPTIQDMGGDLDDSSMSRRQGSVDAELWERLAETKRIDGSDDYNPEIKRSEWLKLADDASANEQVKQSAMKRAEQWGDYAIAEARRARKAVMVCDRYHKDKLELIRLENIDEGTVPAAMKQSQRKTFERAYGPFEKDVLSDCEGWRAKSEESWIDDALARYDAQQQVEERIPPSEALPSKAYKVRAWKHGVTAAGGVLTGLGGALVLAGIFYHDNYPFPNVDLSSEEYDEHKEKRGNGTAAFVWTGVGAAGLGIILFSGGLLWPTPKEGVIDTARTTWRLTPGPGEAGVGTTVTF